MSEDEFLKIVNDYNKGKSYGLLPQPIPANIGLSALIEHFLGKDWYVTSPISEEQAYTEAICDILRKTQKR